MNKYSKENLTRNITEIEGGYWVRFQFEGKVIRHKCFYASHCKTIKRALTLAIIWRNRIEKELETMRKDAAYWSHTNKYYISGLNWAQYCTPKRFDDRLSTYAVYPKGKDKRKNASFSITKFGLEEAFNQAIISLEKKRYGKPYPLDVKKKAFRKLKRDYKRYSVTEF